MAAKLGQPKTLPGDAGIGTLARDIHFISANKGFIVGAINASQYCIWTTNNGGDSWTINLLPIVDIFGSLRAIQFIDQQNGYIVGDGNIALKTVDGGQNWLPLTIDNRPDKDFVALNFIDNNIGFVLSIDFTFYRTTDGGQTGRLMKLLFLAQHRN